LKFFPHSSAAALVLVLALACQAPNTYGEGVREGDAIPAATLLATPERYDGQTLVVEGVVTEVCPKKGCWMTMHEGGQTMRITFKDYGFFVPLDCAGSIARIEGVFAIREVPEGEAKHYLEDAGRHEEAAKIEGPVRSPTFVATGVVLKAPDAR
jgi:hypothetical protein